MAGTQLPNGGPQILSKGYEKILEHVEELPQSAYLRKFAAEKHKMLLIEQDEIADRVSKLDAVGMVDETLEDPKGGECQCCCLRKQKARSPRDLQVQRNLELSEMIRHYHVGLLQLREINEIKAPEENSVKFFWRFLNKAEAQVWHPSHYPDFAPLQKTGDEERDLFTQWIESKVVLWFHNWLGTKVKDPHPITKDMKGREWWSYDIAMLRRAVSICRTIIACLFGTLPLIALSSTKDLSVRLGLNVVFTFLFASVFATMTIARPRDIFAITTAFAAIQVVFVGPNSGKC